MGNHQSSLQKDTLDQHKQVSERSRLFPIVSQGGHQQSQQRDNFAEPIQQTRENKQQAFQQGQRPSSMDDSQREWNPVVPTTLVFGDFNEVQHVGGVRGVPADGELESYNVIDKNLPPGQFLGTVQEFEYQFQQDQESEDHVQDDLSGASDDEIGPYSDTGDNFHDRQWEEILEELAKWDDPEDIYRHLGLEGGLVLSVEDVEKILQSWPADLGEALLAQAKLNVEAAEQRAAHPPASVATPPQGQAAQGAAFPRPALLKVRGQAGSTYGALLRQTPVENVRLPANVAIGILELCVFFPNAFKIPNVILRAVRNGWDTHDLAKAQLNATNELNESNLKTSRDRIKKQQTDGARKEKLCDADRVSTKAVRDHGVVDDLTTSTWKLRRMYGGCTRGPLAWGDMLLRDIGARVHQSRWPTGEDRLTLTRCLEFAMDNADRDLNTSDYDLIIAELGLIPAPLDHNHDQEAAERLREDVEDPTS